jgi:hypothetical protein
VRSSPSPTRRESQEGSGPSCTIRPFVGDWSGLGRLPTSVRRSTGPLPKGPVRHQHRSRVWTHATACRSRRLSTWSSNCSRSHYASEDSVYSHVQVDAEPAVRATVLLGLPTTSAALGSLPELSSDGLERGLGRRPVSPADPLHQIVPVPVA